MATQSGTLTVNASQGLDQEVDRMLRSVNTSDLPYQTYFSTRTDSKSDTTFEQDYHIPSDISDAEIGGVGQESDVQNRTAVNEVVVNHFQTLSMDSEVFKSRANSVTLPGGIGSVDRQEMELRLRIMRAKDKIALSNRASRAAAGAGTPGRAGGAVTFLGNGYNADGTINSAANGTGNEAVTSIASTFNFQTNGVGGYNPNTKLSNDWNENVSASARADLDINDVIRAHSAIRQNLDSLRSPDSPVLSEQTNVAFIPEDSYTDMTVSNPTGLAALNRFTVRMNGVPTELTAQVMTLKTHNGTIVLRSVTDLKSDNTNTTKWATILHGSAGGIVDSTPCTTEKLLDRKTTSHCVANCTFTVVPPHAKLGQVILGVS